MRQQSRTRLEHAYRSRRRGRRTILRAMLGIAFLDAGGSAAQQATFNQSSLAMIIYEANWIAANCRANCSQSKVLTVVGRSLEEAEVNGSVAKQDEFVANQIPLTAWREEIRCRAAKWWAAAHGEGNTTLPITAYGCGARSQEEALQLVTQAFRRKGGRVPNAFSSYTGFSISFRYMSPEMTLVRREVRGGAVVEWVSCRYDISTVGYYPTRSVPQVDRIGPPDVDDRSLDCGALSAQQIASIISQ